MCFARSVSYSLVLINLFIFSTFSAAFVKFNAVLQMEEDPLMLPKGDTVSPS